MANIPVLTEASILFSLMSTEDIIKEQIKVGDVCIAAISGGMAESGCLSGIFEKMLAKLLGVHG